MAPIAESARMLSAASGARPRFVWTRIPVALITGMMREAQAIEARTDVRDDRVGAEEWPFDCDRSACRCRRTASTTTGAGSPVSPNDCRILSTEGIARRREVFDVRLRTLPCFGDDRLRVSVRSLARPPGVRLRQGYGGRPSMASQP